MIVSSNASNSILISEEEENKEAAEKILRIAREIPFDAQIRAKNISLSKEYGWNVLLPNVIKKST